MRRCLILLFLCLPAQAAENYDHLFERWGSVYGVDPRLIKAIAITESNLNARAINNEGSYGLMQIHVKCDDLLCRPELNKFDAWPPKDKQQLFNPEYSIQIAAQIIRDNIKRLGVKRGILAYNCGDAWYHPSRCDWNYFRKVRANYK